MRVQPKAVFAVNMLGFKIEAFERHLTVTDRRSLFGFLWPTVTMVPYMSIASVEASGLTGRLTVKTNDGKTREWHVGGLTGGAVRLRDAIVARM